MMFSSANSNVGVACTPFNAGSKSLLVAGGKLALHGWDLEEEDLIESWSPLVEMAEGAIPTPTLQVVHGALPPQSSHESGTNNEDTNTVFTTGGGARF